MGQLIREHLAIVEATQSESNAVAFSGNVFGHVEVYAIEGSIPTDSFQVLVATQKEPTYFEAAKDQTNTEVAAQAFSPTNRIFNIPPETMAVRQAKIKLTTPLPAGTKLGWLFTGFTNDK